MQSAWLNQVLVQPGTLLLSIFSVNDMAAGWGQLAVDEIFEQLYLCSSNEVPMLLEPTHKTRHDGQLFSLRCMFLGGDGQVERGRERV